MEEGIRLDFPMDKPVAATVPEGVVDPWAMWRCSGLVWVPRHRCYSSIWQIGGVNRIAADFVRLGATMEAAGLHGPIVTAAASSPMISSRASLHGLGINEDPVTGSRAHVLAPYWSGCLGNQPALLSGFGARGQLWVRLLPAERWKLSVRPWLF